MTDDFSKWPAAKELIAVGQGIWGMPQKTHLTLPPPPYLRKTFTADRAIKRALVHATALGLYELHLNGERVGKDYFTPGWTDYKKRVYYNTYDVTNLSSRATTPSARSSAKAGTPAISRGGSSTIGTAKTRG